MKLKYLIPVFFLIFFIPSIKAQSCYYSNGTHCAFPSDLRIDGICPQNYVPDGTFDEQTGYGDWDCYDPSSHLEYPDSYNCNLQTSVFSVANCIDNRCMKIIAYQNSSISGGWYSGQRLAISSGNNYLVFYGYPNDTVNVSFKYKITGGALLSVMTNLGGGYDWLLVNEPATSGIQIYSASRYYTPFAPKVFWVLCGNSTFVYGECWIDGFSIYPTYDTTPCPIPPSPTGYTCMNPKDCSVYDSSTTSGMIGGAFCGVYNFLVCISPPMLFMWLIIIGALVIFSIFGLMYAILKRQD
jgi:hypothetical protein